MNRKRYKIAALTLTLLLVCSTAAYALSATCKSKINTSLSTINGYSTTSCDTSCDELGIVTWLFEDGTVVDTNSESGSGTYLQAATSAGNSLGTQTWSVQGYHDTTLNGVYKTYNSFTSLKY